MKSALCCNQKCNNVILLHFWLQQRSLPNGHGAASDVLEQTESTNGDVCPKGIMRNIYYGISLKLLFPEADLHTVNITGKIRDVSINDGLIVKMWMLSFTTQGKCFRRSTK